MTPLQSWDAPRHQDLFVERYSRLRGWALRLSRGDHGEADDLLHNAFLQFVLRRRELSEIDNLEGYLFGLLRRLRMSSTRTALNRRQEPLSVVDYDAAALCLTDTHARGPLHRMQVAQELGAVCEYACRRKDTSKAGSVLILRFFHGYYPKEIARILRSPLRLANDWLRIARREARAFLARPPARAIPAAAGSGDGASAADTLHQLRVRIHDARTGACLTPLAIARLYDADTRTSLPGAALSHIVSCPACLQLVTTHLHLGPYADRDPRDMLGPDDSWRTSDETGRTPSCGRLIAGATIAIALALWALLPWRSTTALASELLRAAAQTLLIRIEGVVRTFAVTETRLTTAPVASALAEPDADGADRNVTPGAVPAPTMVRIESPRPSAATVEAHNRLELDELFAQHRLEAAPSTTAATGSLAWMLERSSAALAEARELERLAAAWTPQRLRTLDADRAATWLDILRDHARRFRRESEEMRRRLERESGIEPTPSIGDESSGGIPSAADTPAVVSRIVALAVGHELTLQRRASPGAADADNLVRSLLAAEREAAWFDQPLLLAR